ncbi:MAG: asparagine synthase-related protein [Bacteroidota bacterium]
MFFKHQTNNKVLVSDNPLNLLDENTKIDEKALQEFLASGYTWQERTLFKDIKQCEPAHVIFFYPDKTEKQKYFSFSTSKIKGISYNEAFHQLSEILENIMQRALKVLGDTPVVVPLTSGYDSRFLAAWFKHNNKNIHTTFTSGKRSSPEFENAEKVAAKLNIPWEPVYLDDENVETHFPGDDTIQKFIEFSFAFSSMGFFQDVIALNTLNFPSNTVIAGGHSGDVTAGSHIWPFQQLMNKPLNLYYAFQRMFPYFNASSKEKTRLKQTLQNKYDQSKGDIPFSIIQEIDFSERQSKFIVNSCLGYNFFTSGTILPFFDNEFVDFFKDLPFQYRFNKKLYNNVLIENYFKPLDLNFQKEHQDTPSDLYRQMLKQSLPKSIQDIYSKRHPLPDHLNYFKFLEQLSGNSLTTLKNIHKYPNQHIIEWYIQTQLYKRI